MSVAIVRDYPFICSQVAVPSLAQNSTYSQLVDVSHDQFSDTGAVAPTRIFSSSKSAYLTWSGTHGEMITPYTLNPVLSLPVPSDRPMTITLAVDVVWSSTQVLNSGGITVQKMSPASFFSTIICTSDVVPTLAINLVTDGFTVGGFTTKNQHATVDTKSLATNLIMPDSTSVVTPYNEPFLYRLNDKHSCIIVLPYSNPATVNLSLVLKVEHPFCNIAATYPSFTSMLVVRTLCVTN
jgi:hypothetical protein